MALKGLFRGQPAQSALSTPPLADLPPQSFSLLPRERPRCALRLAPSIGQRELLSLFAYLRLPPPGKSGFAEFLFGAIPLALQTPVTKLHVIPESSQIMVSILFPLNFQRYMQEKFALLLCSLSLVADTAIRDLVNQAQRITPRHRLPLHHRVLHRSIDQMITALQAPCAVLRIRVNFSIGLLVSVFRETAFLGSFVFSHFDLVSYYLHTLREKIERILVGMYVEKNFKHVSFTFLALQQNEAVRGAVAVFQHLLSTFITAPRIRQPLWLEVGTFPHLRKDVLPRFLAELRALYQSTDTVLTNRFLSSVLTGVLAHHRSWLASVGSPQQRDAKLSLIHSQLAELFGHPPFSSANEIVHTRVVIVGKKADVVTRMLFFLSYFIRCTELSAHHDLADAQCPPLQGLLKHLADGQGIPTASAVPLATAEVGDSGAPGEVELQWVGMPALLSSPHAAAKSVPLSSNASPSSPSSPSTLPFRTLAHSLFVACGTRHVSHAALQGASQRPADLMALIAQDLYTAVSQPLVPGTRAAVCVVANLDTGDCDLLAHYPLHVALSPRTQLVIGETKYEDVTIERILPSDLVSSLLSDVVSFNELGVPADNVLQYLEDRLLELRVQAELLCGAVGSGQAHIGSPLAPENFRLAELSKALGFSKGDLSLLLALAVSLGGSDLLDKAADVLPAAAPRAP